MGLEVGDTPVLEPQVGPGGFESFVERAVVGAELAHALDDAAARKLLADFETTTTNWLTQALPSLAASMKVAIEIYETFGGGMTTIEDPTDAAIWNNKYFVWRRNSAAERSKWATRFRWASCVWCSSPGPRRTDIHPPHSHWPSLTLVKPDAVGATTPLARCARVAGALRNRPTKPTTLET